MLRDAKFAERQQSVSRVQNSKGHILSLKCWKRSDSHVNRVAFVVDHKVSVLRMTVYGRIEQRLYLGMTDEPLRPLGWHYNEVLNDPVATNGKHVVVALRATEKVRAVAMRGVTDERIQRMCGRGILLKQDTYDACRVSITVVVSGCRIRGHLHSPCAVVQFLKRTTQDILHSPAF